MKKIILILLIISPYVVYTQWDNAETQKQLIKKTIELNDLRKSYVDLKQDRDSLKNKLDNYDTLLNSDIRLYQHFIASKYSKLECTPENIRKFLTEMRDTIKTDEILKYLNVDESLFVAQRETFNGVTGVGRDRNNHHGWKVARNRFSWRIGVGSSNYVIFESWPYSYLEFYEFKKNGGRTWAEWKSFVKKSDIKKKSKKRTK